MVHSICRSACPLQHLSFTRLTTAKGHKVRRSVPRDLAEILELIRNLWDSSTNDGLKGQICRPMARQVSGTLTLSSATRNMPSRSEAARTVRRVPRA